MNDKGFISVEYIFAFFIIITIACGLLFYSESTVGSSFNIEDGISHRMVLDDVAYRICQVNSNGVGYSKNLKLPGDMGYFEITIDKSKATIEYDGKKGETFLPLANADSKYRLISGRSYCITKTDDGIVIS